MKKASLYELKHDLSSLVSEAEHGTEVLITRHNKPVARLTPCMPEHVHSGSRFGSAALKPAVRGKTAGRYLRILEDDRRSGRE